MGLILHHGRRELVSSSTALHASLHHHGLQRVGIRVILVVGTGMNLLVDLFRLVPGAVEGVSHVGLVDTTILAIGAAEA